jgi:hypothetical protein
MNNDLTTRPDNRLDHVLATEEPLVPSSGFAAGVMERITDEAARSHKPLLFPWRRILPGIILLVPGFAYLVLQLNKTFTTSGTTQADGFIPQAYATITFNPQYTQMLLWLAAAAALTFIIWRITQRLVGLR